MVLPKLKQMDLAKAEQYIANVIVFRHQSVPADDRPMLRVLLFKSDEVDALASWNIGAPSWADMENVAKAIASDVVAEANKKGPASYKAVVAARTILGSVAFFLPVSGQATWVSKSVQVVSKSETPA